MRPPGSTATSAASACWGRLRWGCASRATGGRAAGVLAVALCQRADGRLDGVASLKPSRSVDIAAAALIVREAGAHVETRAPAAMPLALSTRAHVVAARDPAMADRLSGLLWP